MISKSFLKRALCSMKQSSKCVVVMRMNSVWSEEKIVKSQFPTIEIPNCTLYDYVWQNLEKWPERTAAVCSVTGRGYTYEQAFKLSNAFAANLRRKLNIRDGNAVAVMLPNIPDFPLVAMGILEAGGVITTINPVNTADEVQRQLLMSDAKVIITLPELVTTVQNAIKIAKVNLPIIVIKTSEAATPDGTILFNELSEDIHVDTSCLKEVRRTAKDICFLPYSSGTTGLPKGVELTNRNIISNLEQINEPALRTHNDTTATQQDAVMTILPMYHIYAASVIMFHKMSVGCKLVTLSKFQPEPFLKALRKHRTCSLFAAPPIILMMAAHPAATAETYQYLDTIINGAAPLSATDADRLLLKVGRELDFRQGYGLTETSPVVSISKKGEKDYGSVGYLVPNMEMRIVDSELQNLGPNEKGEILTKGPNVMKGYRNNPTANAEVFTEDGWFRTGDMAIVDDNGLVTITDRLKELIKVKGYQVPPAELEAVLREHPAVADAAVVGVPHPTKGEAPKAFVVVKNKIEAKDICEFVNAKVSPYKRIDDVLFIDAIPKSAAGKILRKDLKTKYC